MADQPSGVDNVVERWDRTRVVSRTLITTTKQSKRWIAVWLTAILLALVILVVNDAPQTAYVVLALVLLVAAAAGTHRSLGSASGRESTETEARSADG